MEKRRRIGHEERLQIAAQQQWKCNECSNTLTSVFEVDHINPLHCGGTNAPSNLQVLCVQCHATKSQRERIAVLKTRKDYERPELPPKSTYREVFEKKWPQYASFIYPHATEKHYFALCEAFANRKKKYNA